MRPLSWQGWTSLSVLSVLLWLFVAPAYLNLGHVHRGDFILNRVGVVWMIVLVGLVLLLITSLHKSKG